MPRFAPEQHGKNCACCVPTTAVESLEEVIWNKSACQAAAVGDLERVKLLVAKNPRCVHNDGKGGDSGYTPLHYAARGGHDAIASVLIAAGAQLDAQTKAGGATPLHRAAFAGRCSTVELLLTAGANILMQDADGETAQHKAAQQQHAAVARLLAERCPELLAVEDRKGRRPDVPQEWLRVPP